MEPVEGTRSFQTTGDAYDRFMGRYSTALAVGFADALGVQRSQRAVDVGCGPGALTAVLVETLGADAVAACDPTPAFVEECARRHPGVDVRQGRAEVIPFATGAFDVAAAQLVLHFVTDAPAAAAELRRVVRPGGTIGACVWDFDEGMQMLRAFWDAALVLDPDAPDEARTLRFGRPGEIAALFAEAGLAAITETNLDVQSTYADFDELWTGFTAGIGPAGAYCANLPEDARSALRAELFERVGRPSGQFTLTATARCAIAVSPD